MYVCRTCPECSKSVKKLSVVYIHVHFGKLNLEIDKLELMTLTRVYNLTKNG